jgi:hypothetical protein
MTKEWIVEAATDLPLRVVEDTDEQAPICTVEGWCGDWGSAAVNNARLIAAAPKMLAALEYAAELVKTARAYFPKSVKNRDRFQLENACATIGKAIGQAKGE